MLKGIFGHLLNGCEGSVKIQGVGKAEASLGNILFTDDTCKGVKTFKQIMVYLPKSLGRTNGNTVDIARLKESCALASESSSISLVVISIKLYLQYRSDGI